jgi:hypothetical protein
MQQRHHTQSRFAGYDARRAWLIAAACTLVALSSSAHAADNIDGSHPEIFVPRFIDAMLSQDLERRLAILHSRSRACVNPQTQPYFDWIFSRQARLVRTGARKVTTRVIAPGAAILPTDGHSDYPTRPTHEIQIDFISGPSSSYTVLLFVASEGAQWREVLPCPRGDVKVRTLLSSMPHELRAELSMLLKSGRKVDAITRYALATGEDIATSKSVVEALAVRTQSQLW